MGFIDLIKQNYIQVKRSSLNLFYLQKPEILPKKEIAFIAGAKPDLSENFKSVVEQNKITFPKDLGEEHPFDFDEVEKLYKLFGLVPAIVDKYVDFIAGVGFYVKCEDKRAQEIIETFLRETEFSTLLRTWLREALLKGNGFLEIGGGKNEVPQGMKVLNAKTIFVNRDEHGEILGYKQYNGNLFNSSGKSGDTEFKPYEIAHIAINVIGDSPYGLGVIYPSLKTINDIIGSQKNAHKLLAKKANSPYHVKVGSVEQDIIPEQGVIDGLKEKLEYQTNDNEWVTGPFVEIKVVEFGNFMDKLAPIMEMDFRKLYAEVQIPEVLMGYGNVPEGLAKVQMDAWERRAQSIQEEVEKVIEQQIFQRVLLANGFQVHVEFEWGRPSNTETNERILRITELLKLFTLSQQMRKMLEKELSHLFGFNTDSLLSPDEERETEIDQQQPMVPGQNRSERGIVVNTPIHKDLLDYGNKTEELQRDYSLEEWLGFNYKQYLDFISAALKRDEFKELKATTTEEVNAGKLSADKIDELRNVLNSGFRKGHTLREITKKIEERVKPKDLYATQDGKFLFNENGDRILRVSAEYRGVMLARSETTRFAALGAEENYKQAGIEKYVWVAAVGDRTCPICAELNGQVFEIGAGEKPPAHGNCRCSIVAQGG